MNVPLCLTIWKNPKRIFVDVNTAELSNLIECVSKKTQDQEVSDEVSKNLGGIDVGKVVGAQGNSSQGGNGAGTNTSKDMVKVFSGKKVVGLVWRTGEVALIGVEFCVVGGSSTHAVDEVDIREIWLYLMLYPDVK